MSWQQKEAKNGAGEVMNLAMKEGSQIITRHDQPAVVVVSVDQCQNEAGKERLSGILRDCPAKGWKLSRSRDTRRTLHFE